MKNTVWTISIPAGEKLKAGQAVFAKGHGGKGGLKVYATRPTLLQRFKRLFNRHYLKY